MSNPKEPLLGSNPHDGFQSKLQYALEKGFLAVKVVLALNGTFVLLFYPGPAATCAEAVNCGKWFADIVGKEVAIGVYTAGGLGFVATNAYFSFASLDTFVDYIKKQPTYVEQILKGAFVVAFTASQVAPALFNSMQTATSPVITMLSVAGVIPGGLYVAAKSAKNQIPAVISNGRSTYRDVSFRIRQKWFKISNEEIATAATEQCYQLMHKKFNQQLKANWDYLVQHYGEYKHENVTDELELLFMHAAAIYRETRSQQALNVIKVLIVIGLTALMTIPFLMPTIEIFNQWGVPTSGSYAITGFFNLSQVVGNHKFVDKAISGAFDTASKKISGGNIPSIHFAKHAYISSAALTVSFLLAVLSYCYADTLYQKNFPSEDTGLRLFGRVGADVAINIYHFAGFFAVYQMAFGGFTNFTTTRTFAVLASYLPFLNSFKNPTDKLFFKAEEEKDKLLNMTDEQFVKFYNENKENLSIFPNSNNGAAPEPDEDTMSVEISNRGCFC